MPSRNVGEDLVGRSDIEQDQFLSKLDLNNYLTVQRVAEMANCEPEEPSVCRTQSYQDKLSTIDGRGLYGLLGLEISHFRKIAEDTRQQSRGTSIFFGAVRSFLGIYQIGRPLSQFEKNSVAQAAPHCLETWVFEGSDNHNRRGLCRQLLAPPTAEKTQWYKLEELIDDLCAFPQATAEAIRDTLSEYLAELPDTLRDQTDQTDQDTVPSGMLNVLKGFLEASDIDNKCQSASAAKKNTANLMALTGRRLEAYTAGDAHTYRDAVTMQWNVFRWQAGSTTLSTCLNSLMNHFSDSAEQRSLPKTGTRAT
ncbi:hypothetical protein BDV96DRAFT_658719 [Lophiotrema nucula]|uniref:Uncharacterized protein n=1 Tax=Lophiotrema nucula TaxID=690887 RepID=A0A6A5ZAZ9_9PLEO|nr:hypothetical protein BDV96DRAFT_658719 [Lophiotrema nucula]